MDDITKSLELINSQIEELLSNQVELEFIDIRELGEIPRVEFVGQCIPLSALADQVNKIPREKFVILFCRSGTRSLHAVKVLREHFNFKSVYSLKGGLLELTKSGQSLLGRLNIIV